MGNGFEDSSGHIIKYTNGRDLSDRERNAWVGQERHEGS